MLQIISQVAIAVFGASAIWFVGRKEKWKRWGYILGLIGQPFWFYTTIVNEQWGIFALCLFYTYSWGQGVWNYWIKPDEYISKRTLEMIDKSMEEYKKGNVSDPIDIDELNELLDEEE